MLREKVLIKSYNLIGDSLQAGIAINEFHKKYSDKELWIEVPQNHTAPLYSRMTGYDVISHSTEYYTEPYLSKFKIENWNPFSEVYELKAGEAGVLCDKYKIHIADAFCRMLGFELEREWIDIPGIGRFKNICPYLNVDDIPVKEENKNLILFSPFSMSCTSQEKDEDGKLKGKPPNKMLSMDCWKHILKYLRNTYPQYPIRMLGAKEDDAPELELMGDEYLTGVPLLELAAIMKYSKLVITVDNGMGHLAASQHANQVLFYPICLGWHFILPWGNPNIVPAQVNPATVNPAEVLWFVKQAVPHLLNRNL